MADNEFYAVENGHNVRQIRILSVGSLVSKPPAKEKRISIKVRMTLSETVNMGSPEKIDAAYMFVARNHQKIILDSEFEGYCIEFSVENLFGEPIVSNDCIMKSFEIFEMGKDESPDVVMTFTIRTSFTSKKWDWYGQFVGEDVWAKFTPGEAGTAKVEEEDGTLLDDGENEDDGDLDQDNEEDAGEDADVGQPDVLEYEDETPGKKHDAKELAAYHENVVTMEQAPKAIRRPKGFAKPLHEGNEF
jgi:hypothetical protein